MKIKSDWELKLQEDLLRTLEENGHKWKDQADLERRKAEIVNAINEYKEEEPEAPEEPMDILEGYLAETGATVYLGCGGWVLVDDGDEMSFGTWQEMIDYIKEEQR